jgi:hypothetical protein
LFARNLATEIFLCLAKEKSHGNLVCKILSFQRSDQKRTVEPSPILHSAIPLKRSQSLSTSLHQKDPLSVVAWGDLVLWIVSILNQFDPWDVFFVVELVQMLEKESFILGFEIDDSQPSFVFGL